MLNYIDTVSTLLISERLIEKESLRLILKGMGSKRTLMILSRLGLG